MWSMPRSAPALTSATAVPIRLPLYETVGRRAVHPALLVDGRLLRLIRYDRVPDPAHGPSLCSVVSSSIIAGAVQWPVYRVGRWRTNCPTHPRTSSRPMFDLTAEPSRRAL